MAADTPQRAYRAACPGCGAPIEFRSAQSTHAVCAYCQSTVVRSGDTLARIGKMAELFNDFSPLQLQASGVFEGRRFTLLGRLQYHYPQGTWTEWYALLDDGSAAFLSEDNGAYVFTRPASASREIPPADQFRVGASTAINGTAYTVASNETVALLSAQGELPHLPALGTAVCHGRAAQRRRRGAEHRLRPGPGRRQACAVARPRGAAGRPAAHRPEGRIGHRRKRRPAVQLPALRRAGRGHAGHQPEHHLPFVQQPDRPVAGRGRATHVGAAGRAGQPADCAGRRGPAAGRELAGGRFSAPHGA